MRNPYAPPAADVGHATGDTAASSGEVEYAGFGRRVGSALLDVLIFLPISAGVAYLLQSSRVMYLVWEVPSLLLGVWFTVYLVVRYGGTPGKLLVGTRITLLDGQPVTYKAAWLRYLVDFAVSVLMAAALAISAYHMTNQEFSAPGYLAHSQHLVAGAPRWYSLVTLLSGSWFVAKIITVLASAKHGAAHDFVAGTVVVRT